MDRPKPKVTAKVDVKAVRSLHPPSRPTSPSKSPTKPTYGSLGTSPRPKAKVSSSATISRKTSVSSSISTPNVRNGRTVASSPASRARSRSPFKPSVHETSASSYPASPPSPVRPTGRITAKPSSSTSLASKSVSDGLFRQGSPEVRHQRSVTSLAAPGNHRARQASLTLQRSPSRTSLAGNTPTISGAEPRKLRARVVSGITGPRTSDGSTDSGASLPQLSSPPLVPSTSQRTVVPRSRAPSISSALALTDSPTQPSKPLSQTSTPNGSHVFHPITTAVPAANPHRFDPPRPHQHTPSSPLQSVFSSPPPSQAGVTGLGMLFEADPNGSPTRAFTSTVPPPTSPPTSALSFSSQSSMSPRINGIPMSPPMAWRRDSGISAVTSGSSSLASPDTQSDTVAEFDDHGGPSATTEGDAGGSARSTRAEAKTNRKIADLEITNRSLLAINSSLESAKHKQALELRELRRRLRETRLALPPKTFKQLSHRQEVDLSSCSSSSSDEEEDYPGQLVKGKGKADEAYARVTALISGLIETGRAALEYKPRFSSEGALGPRMQVLHVDEARKWHVGDDSFNEADISFSSSRLGSEEPDPSGIPIPDSDSDGDSLSEEERREVEDSLNISLSTPLSPFADHPLSPPMVTLTPSPRAS